MQKCKNSYSPHYAAAKRYIGTSQEHFSACSEPNKRLHAIFRHDTNNWSLKVFDYDWGCHLSKGLFISTI